MGTKPGWRTTEFWVSIITALLILVNTIFGTGLNAEQIATTIAPLIAYIISRGIAKTGGG